MRIGVLGDTHNNLRNVDRIAEIFELSGVERIVHTGDITQPKVLDALAHLPAEIHGVYGNNDIGERNELSRAAIRHKMSFHDGPLELHWANRRIMVVHDPRDFEGALTSQHDLGLHGHTHLYRLDTVGETLVFNPGECAGMMKGHNRVGIVDLDSLTCNVEYF